MRRARNRAHWMIIAFSVSSPPLLWPSTTNDLICMTAFCVKYLKVSTSLSMSVRMSLKRITSNSESMSMSSAMSWLTIVSLFFTGADSASGVDTGAGEGAEGASDPEDEDEEEEEEEDDWF